MSLFLWLSFLFILEAAKVKLQYLTFIVIVTHTFYGKFTQQFVFYFCPCTSEVRESVILSKYSLRNKTCSQSQMYPRYYPAGIYLFKVKNRSPEQCVKYVQS